MLIHHCACIVLSIFRGVPKNTCRKGENLPSTSKCSGPFVEERVKDIGIDDDRMWALYASRAVWSLLACTVTAQDQSTQLASKQLVDIYSKRWFSMSRGEAVEEIDKILDASTPRKLDEFLLPRLSMMRIESTRTFSRGLPLTF